MRRRQFLWLLGSALAPALARAQTPSATRRIGVLSGQAETGEQSERWVAAFRKSLGQLGWVDGRTVQIDYRWGAGNVDRLQPFAEELVRLNPDVLVGITTLATAALKAETRTIPIISVASDPVGSGFVESLAKPGGDITGFINMEGSLGGKWVELLREVAPAVSRVGLLFNPQTAPFARYYLDSFHAAAATLKLEPIDTQVRAAAEIEPLITKLGHDGNAGLIVMPDSFAEVYCDAIVSLINGNRLPAIYPFRVFALAGGLLSYGVDLPDLAPGMAAYIDRILKGAKPSELPVQLPTKFDMTINLKTAKALGFAIPQSLLVSADELIE